MERIQMPKLRNSTPISWDSETCDQHPNRKTPVKKMKLNGELICPLCKRDEANLEFETEVNSVIKAQLQNAEYEGFAKYSLVEDETLLKARVYNFSVTIQEEADNKHKVQEAIKRYKAGEKFNLVLQGNPGAGKSHLGYAILHELNEERKYSCLFVSVEAMLRKIKESFNNKESKYTEEYFNKLLSAVDFLVLDDLGAETGAINTDKSATDFVQRVLYGIATSRQNKATILTTNLNSQALFNMYDRKLVSRLLKNPEVIVFRETSDKRITTLF